MTCTSIQLFGQIPKHTGPLPAQFKPKIFLHSFFSTRIDFVPIEFKQFPLRVTGYTQKLQMKLLVQNIERAVLKRMLFAPLRPKANTIEPLAIQNPTHFKINLSKWMENLSSKVKRWPVNRLHFPGTHNSGSYMTTLNHVPIESPVMQVGEWAAAQYSQIRELISDFSVFQNRSIQEQLKLGVRFLDVRYAYSEVSNAPYASHEIAAAKLETIFQDVADFLEENRQEVVFISIRREDSFEFGNPCTDEIVLDLVFKKIGHLMAKRGTFDKTMSIEEMAKRNKRVIFFDLLETSKHEELRWSWSAFELPWKGTKNFSKKIEYLTNDAKTLEFDSKIVNGLQFIATPGKLDILENREKRVGYQSMREWRATMQRHLPKFLEKNREHIFKNHVAIFTTDFPEEHFTRSIIALNFEKEKSVNNKICQCPGCCIIV